MSPTIALLCVVSAFIAWTMYRAQKDPNFQFNLFDLIMENGKVSKISVAFMLTLVFTTWLMLDLALKGKMTEGYLTTYGAMWVAPLVARVIFGKTSAAKGGATS
jgi:hypothetical protein